MCLEEGWPAPQNVQSLLPVFQGLLGGWCFWGHLGRSPAHRRRLRRNTAPALQACPRRRSALSQGHRAAGCPGTPRMRTVPVGGGSGTGPRAADHAEPVAAPSVPLRTSPTGAAGAETRPAGSLSSGPWRLPRLTSLSSGGLGAVPYRFVRVQGQGRRLARRPDSPSCWPAAKPGAASPPVGPAGGTTLFPARSPPSSCSPSHRTHPLLGSSAALTPVGPEAQTVGEPGPALPQARAGALEARVSANTWGKRIQNTSCLRNPQWLAEQGTSLCTSMVAGPSDSRLSFPPGTGVTARLQTTSPWQYHRLKLQEAYRPPRGTWWGYRL